MANHKRVRWTIDNLKEAVASSINIAQVFSKLNLKPSGPSYKAFHSDVEQHNIDTAHLLGKGHMFGRNHTLILATPLEEVQVEHSTYPTSRLRQRLLKEGILEAVCSICGIKDWMGNSLTLHLDHINGRHRDHRSENLRLLCPNCHSQTENYCSRNRQLSTDILEAYGIDRNLGGAEQRKQLRLAIQLNPKKKNCGRPHKIPHPTKDELQKLLWEMPTTHIAKQFGVSDKAVEKWSKIYGCTKPNRGYWIKIRSMT